jgi:hypothetical protein
MLGVCCERRDSLNLAYAGIITPSQLLLAVVSGDIYVDPSAQITQHGDSNSLKWDIFRWPGDDEVLVEVQKIIW